MVCQLDRHLAASDTEIGKRLAEGERLARRTEILTSIPGVSRVTAAGLLTQMPELGCLDAKAVASLAGLTPVTRQSGAWQGRSFIQGGRARAAFRGEAARRERLLTELRTARLTGIRVAVPVEALEGRLASLPEVVHVARDRIEVRFSGAQEAVGRLFALAQALTNDYEQFEALVEEGEAAGGGGEGRQ